MATHEEAIAFVGGPWRLEGRLGLGSGAAVIICHPHPLYGGALDHPVVETLASVYRQLGYTTLRFNFRGVGASTGTYDDGRGEQDDVRAAAAYLAGLGKTVTDLAGYSFGAWVQLHLRPPIATVQRQVLIAPPVAYLAFAAAVEPPPELIVVTGDQDRIAPAAMLREQAPRWRPAARLRVLAGVDHFYAGALPQLAALLLAELASDRSASA